MPYVVHVVPKLFGEQGYWGGGERYALELARAEAELVPTRLVSFGPRRLAYKLGALEIHVLPTRFEIGGSWLNPVSELLPLELADSEVIHVHQSATGLADIVILLGAVLRKRVFVTDLGGTAPSLRRLFDTSRFAVGHLAVSRFAAEMSSQCAGRAAVIYGGADTNRFTPGLTVSERESVVYVGRLLPHKGVHDLIDALDPGVRLELYGRSYDSGYRQALERKAAGKSVRFVDDASDADLVRALQAARVAVLPSVHQSPFGGPYAKPELLGLALIEAMACATPVIASSAASLPEVVVDGTTGFVFEAGNPAALRSRLRQLVADDALWQEMSVAALARVHDTFTWEHTAARALDAYAELDPRRRG